MANLFLYGDNYYIKNTKAEQSIRIVNPKILNVNLNEKDNWFIMLMIVFEIDFIIIFTPSKINLNCSLRFPCFNIFTI